MTSWTTTDDLTTAVRRRWNDGSLLRAFATGAEFPTIDLRIRGPRASDIGDDVARVRDWIAKLEVGARAGGRYRLEWTQIGGRYFGRNQIPARAVISTFEQAWSLLGVGAAVRRYASILELVAPHDAVKNWALAQPHAALELNDDWPALLRAYTWLSEHRDSGEYLRQISAPGVDTKFAERHRSVLAALLGVPGSASGFVAGLGLRAKPRLVRIRVGPGIGLPGPLSELAVRPDELADLAITATSAVVCENEITYLSVPVPEAGVVIWGKGFYVDDVGRLAWLANASVWYWGDLDTHGFAILNQLRARLPQTTSLLMDRQTLFAHQDRWVQEAAPTRSRLGRLRPEESALYEELVSDQHGVRVRLEQERIDWGWVSERIPYASEPSIHQ